MSTQNSQKQISPWKTSAHATAHCLVGCSIGEVLGLMIGVSLGLGVFWTIALAVLLAFVVGISLAVTPIIKDRGTSLIEALKIIWIGEVISIAVMEFAMNAVDLSVGGVDVPTIWTSTFWLGIALAIPSGYILAWPVNHVLLAKHLKSCH
mgnify:FL=1